MSRLAFVLLTLAALLPAQKKQQPKPPEVEVTEIAVHREGSEITLDGKLKNVGERPVKKLNFTIEFRTTDKQVIKTARGEVDETVLDPGGDSEFHVRFPDLARAVYVTFQFEDGSGRYINGVNAGPHTIE